ncbi:MAG: molybdopterin molybdenumtransferase MoeA, partial [Giesbergeria sp.]
MKTIAEIAASLQGYDPQSLHAVQVTAFLEQLVQPVQDCETVELHVALGRVLANDVVSPISVPPHDNSAMDGYAFAGAALRTTNPTVLRSVGTLMAGTPWAGVVGAGECLRIM